MSGPNSAQAEFWEELTPSWLEAERHTRLVSERFGLMAMDRLELVAGQRVLDLASGSGLCAIAAARAGATEVAAIDIDPFAIAAIDLNARANHVHVGVIQRDVLDAAPPDVDVILAGDCWYEAELAARVLPWLEAARDQGSAILVGDPGRRDLPTASLTELAAYDVRTTTELEDLLLTRGMVYALRGDGR
jgi:predicted nicotinamide N-methyase